MLRTNSVLSIIVYQAAYIDGLEDNALYDVLFKEDVEAPRLQYLPGVEEMLQQ